MRKFAIPIAIALFLIALVLVLLSTRKASKHGDEVASTRASSSSQAAAFQVVTLPRPSASSASTSSKPGAGASVLTTVPWGGGPNALGHTRPSEGNPEAPMSLAPLGNGRFVVLDNVNERLSFFDKDGKVQRTVPIGLRAPQDVVPAGDGKLAVMDRLGDKTVAIVDDQGRSVASLSLTSPGLPDPGGISGVFVDGKNVYAEYEHGKLVNLGTTDGTPAKDGDELPGRPSKDGRSVLSAGIISTAEGRMWVSSVSRPDLEHRFTRELRMPMPIGFIAMLDSDARGVVYTAAVLADESQDHAAGVQIVCLSPDKGEPIGGSFVSFPDSPEEIFRSMAVLDNGSVIMAIPTEQGMQYQVVGGC